MSKQKPKNARSIKDRDAEHKIETLKKDIESWAIARELWHDSGFSNYYEHTGREPSDLPVLSRLSSEGDLSRVLAGEGPFEFEDEFRTILKKHKCWHESEDHVSWNIYPDEDTDFSDLSSFFYWQWVCGLVREDIGDVYSELYSHFGRHPDELYSLDWRSYEILLAEIFKIQGFEVILGRGGNDGGVDIELLYKDPIGDVRTVVQVKKYKSAKKIDLTSVQALYGAQKAYEADASCFVTTSAYLPVAQRFAARENVKMKLATSADVAEWAIEASQGIIKDKSTLVSRENVSKLIMELKKRKDRRLVCAQSGYNMIINKFALVIKESKHAALLMPLAGKVTSHDGYGQRGLEIPDLEPRLPKLNAEGVFRARRKAHDGEVTYWDGYNLYAPWDGEPRKFDYCD